MNVTDSTIAPAPPKLMASLMAGFDAITAHISLIIFPLVLDLLLWLGPHMKINQLVDALVQQIVSLPGVNTPDTADVLRLNQEAWKLLGERINLVASLRTYPVGVSSLMASRLPIDVPKNIQGAGWEVPSMLWMIGIWMLLSLVGYLFGSLYFSAVADASISNKLLWSRVLRRWPWVSVQVVVLAVCWAIIILMALLPATCVIPVLMFSSPSFGRIAMFLYGGFMIWLLFPLVLSPHGIFVKRYNAFASLRQGMYITRMTLPTTGLFFLIILVISQGLNILWQMPAETSWMMLVGVIGHAFVTTGLLAASFIYYNEADRWMQSVRSRWAQQALGVR